MLRKKKIEPSNDAAYRLLISLTKSPVDNSERNICQLTKAILKPATAWPAFSNISYTFELPKDEAAAQSLLKLQPNYVNKNVPLIELSPFSQSLVRESLQWWESTVNLRFIETVQDPNIYIFAFEPISPTSPGGYSCLGTDCLMHSSTRGLGINNDMLPPYHQPMKFTFFMNLIYHEIGHALSLKHPFSTPLAVIDSKFNYTNTTIMAYDHAVNINTKRTIVGITPMPADIDAVQLLYGKNLSDKNNTYNLIEFTPDLPADYESIASLPCAGGIDTLTAGTTYHDVYHDVTLDIRPYGKSSNMYGTVMTPNISIENVVGGYGRNQIYLNALNNEVDVRHSAHTTLFVDARHTGKDSVTGFHPERDQIMLLHPTQSDSWKIKQISLPNDVSRNATLIEFDSENSITLLDVNVAQIHSDSVKKDTNLNEKSESESTCKVSAQEKALWKQVGLLPTQLTLDFFNAFANGTALTFLDALTADILERYQCHPDKIWLAQFILHNLYLLYSGTILTNSVGHMMVGTLKYFNFSERTSYQTAACVTGALHMAQNFTPVGVARTFMNMAGGFAGSNFTLWAHNKIKARIASPTVPVNEDDIDLELGMKQQAKIF
jgi:hypothetical protein